MRGGYVWRSSADLAKREGEGKVELLTVWVQPPGTPFVGEALVDVFEWTGDEVYRDAARETAACLIAGQLRSGGWDASIELDPARRRRYAYRVDGAGSSRQRNNTSLDDDKTQSALRMLMRYDRASGFADREVHEAALFALESLAGAQFPNGAWPHVYTGPPKPEDFPLRRASFYASGVEHTRIKEYWTLYTLNDNLMPDVIDTLLLAWRVYGDDRWLDAVKKAGDFLILAQMPEPQPGWAQQYDFEMRPAWARRFEPAAITGGESQQVMATLMDLCELTGERKYLEPLSRALAYYRRSLLADGRLARFYELGSNEPLYFTKDYELTHSDADMPTHYGFKVSSKLDALQARYDALATKDWSRPKPEPVLAKPRAPDASEVRRVIAALDERGAWVDEGRMRYFGDGDDTRRVIDPRTFARNIRTLAQWIATREE